LAPPNRGSFNSPHIHGTHVPVGEPSTASLADPATHKIKARFVETVGALMALIFPVRSIS
jgi:hypothetical protein